MKRKGPSPKHYCAVTLLSRPPAPTVIVGPAHCTLLCKSQSQDVDNCCCGGPNDCSENTKRCGENPTVQEMTKIDAEIVCGEWETGDTPPESSEEKYNVILQIEEILRHPNYTVNIESSAYIQNDIAVFKVDDTILSRVNTIISSNLYLNNLELH